MKELLKLSKIYTVSGIWLTCNACGLCAHNTHVRTTNMRIDSVRDMCPKCKSLTISELEDTTASIEEIE